MRRFHFTARLSLPPHLDRYTSVSKSHRDLQLVADAGRSCWLDSSESQLQQGRNPSLTASASGLPLLP
jgi:hypothetical protein